MAGEGAGCGIVLGVLALVCIAIAQVVFATMGLAHAVPNLKDPPDFTNTTCITDEDFPPHMLYVWLTVFGSLVWGSLVVGCLFPGTRVNEGTDEEKKIPSPITQLVQLAAFGWVIYGCVIIFDEPIYDNLDLCDDHGTRLMFVICRLFIIVYGILAGIIVLACCTFCCVGFESASSGGGGNISRPTTNRNTWTVTMT